MPASLVDFVVMRAIDDLFVARALMRGASRRGNRFHFLLDGAD